MLRVWVLSALATLGVGAGVGLGCGGVDGLTIAGSGTTGGGGSNTNAVGVPCDVATALAVCVGCHGDPPVGGAVGSLLTYTDLTSPAPTDPTQTMAQMAVVRMQDTAKPMPPGGGATQAQIQALSNWVNAGAQPGTCGTTPDPTFQGAPTCPGNSFFMPDPGVEIDQYGDMMYPGRACITCHQQQGENKFALGGTVFPTGKVLDDCLPSTSGIDWTQVKVVIHDANGDHPLSVNTNGNFRSHTSDNLALPLKYTAKVTYTAGGVTKERAMASTQTSGDCNACHTANGANGAPGRIALPQ
jgi:mono/diheme cytochrome c family protein